MEYQSTLQVIKLDEPVFDNLVIGHPIWPQWDVYSPYDLLPAGLSPSVFEKHLEAPRALAEEPEILSTEPTMPPRDPPLPLDELAQSQAGGDPARAEDDPHTPHDDMMQSP